MSTALKPTSDNDNAVVIDSAVVNSPFLSQTCDQTLRITCYGSSSAQTPQPYLREARTLGYILAKRGHVCVNGAGSFGCMAAMNDGAVAGNGHIVGVIHEMFIVDSGYGDSKKKLNVQRDGTFHQAFVAASTPEDPPVEDRTGPIREIITATGNDLQQRKKFLVDRADGLIVLPGGPGTWDELWEMACARHLGLVENLPIVCVNVAGYYQPFRDMLQRAHQDQLIRLPPEEIVHFAATAEEAVQWIEMQKAGHANQSDKQNRQESFARRTSAVGRSSFMSPPQGMFRRSMSTMSQIVDQQIQMTGIDQLPLWLQLSLTFATGAAVGIAANMLYTKRR